MIDNKKIKDEIKKLNIELESVIKNSNLKLPQLSNIKQFNTPNSLEINSDAFQLLNLIQDVRDEISLLRRNLFSDIESFVNKKINVEQEKFFERIESSFSKVLKESILSRTQHIQEMKNEFSIFHMKMNKINEEIDNLNASNDHIKTLLHNEQSNILTNLEEIDNKFFNTQNLIQENFKFQIQLIKEIKNNPNVSEEIFENKINYDSKKPINFNKNSIQTSKLPSKVENRISRIDAALKRLEEH
ncbi:MAG: hypothetical protein LAT82_02265 [Nanoarchaeota archaeon]|nr:hypothetical protein [Nanoarchaeota archaeon]